MPIVPPRFIRLYSAFFAVFALFGTSITIVGATLPTILAAFKWNYGTAGLVMAAGAIGYFFSTFIAGRVFGSLGPKASLAFGLLLDTVGLAFFASVPSPLANLLLYFAIGFGQGFIEVTVNWSVLRMKEPEDSNSGHAMSLMHGAFAIGAVAGPFVLGWLLSASLPWETLYRGIAALFGILLVSVVILPMRLLGRESGDGSAEVVNRLSRTRSPSRSASEVASGTVSTAASTAVSAATSMAAPPENHLSRSPAYWLGFLALLIYVGVELGISNWSAEYFVSVFGATPATGSFMVSLFWTGLLAGRFGLPLLGKRLSQQKILIVISILLAVSSGLLALLGFLEPSFRSVGYILVFLSGLGCSSIYPIVVSIVGETFPKAQAKAVGFAATGGGLGAFMFPYLMSLVSGGLGIRFGFAVYAVFAVASLFSCRALIAASGKRRRQFPQPQ